MHMLNRRTLKPLLKVNYPIKFYAWFTHTNHDIEADRLSLGYREFQNWLDMEKVLNRKRIRVSRHSVMAQGAYIYNSRNNHIHLSFNPKKMSNELNTVIIIADTNHGLRITDIRKMKDDMVNHNELTFEYFV